MALFVRKIARAKWDDATRVDLVKADAITGCLRTTQNTLSLWKIDTEEELKTALLDIVSCHDKPDTVDLVYFDEGELAEKKLDIDNVVGDTLVEHRKMKHYDIISLDYSKLAAVADIILCAKKKARIKRYSKKEIIELLKDAIAQGNIKPDNLKEQMKKEVLK